MSIFTAIGSLVGGLFGSSAAKKQQQQAQQWQEHMAKNQVRFRVEDAKAAGVHPLAALGASLHSPSFTPVSGPDFGDMGQNIGRALDATMTSKEKNDDYTKAAQALTLEKMQLENDVIRNNLVASAIRTTNQPANAPKVNDMNELVEGLHIVPGRPTRQEVQEHNRWYGYDLPRGPTGQDWENQISDWSNIPAFFRMMEIARRRFGPTNWSRGNYESQRRRVEDHFSRAGRSARRSSGW